MCAVERLLASIVALFALSSCGMFTEGNSTPTPPPTVTAEATEAVGWWHEVDADGVALGLWVPAGWEIQDTDDGLLLAEDFATIASGMEMKGMQIHVFVRSIHDFPHVPEAKNMAWGVLKEIIHDPDYIGEALVSEPVGFDWDGHDAAYYLLNDGDGSKSILMAVALETPQKLIVCNFTSPANQSQRIRAMLPEILSTLTINGVNMDMSPLHSLPDPFVFPKGY